MSSEETWTARFGAIVERETGIVLSSSMALRLASVLQARAAATAAGSVDAYLRELDRGARNRPMPEELQRLVNVFTVGKTSFFRYPEQIGLIVELLVPALDRMLRGDDTINIWSAGCSTGEEIFSLAMALHDAGWLGSDRGRRFLLLGSDINTESLRTAESGRIDLVRVGQIPAVAMRHCLQDGGELTVAPAIRQHVGLRHVNLSDERYPVAAGGWHVVVCANVLIYFGEQTTQRVLRALRRVLAPTAAVLVGGAETLALPTSADVAEGGRLQPIQRGDAFAHITGAWGDTLVHGLATESPLPADAAIAGHQGAAAAQPPGRGSVLSDDRRTGGRGADGLPPTVAAEGHGGHARAARPPCSSPSASQQGLRRATGPAGSAAHAAELDKELDRAASLAGQGQRADAIALLRGLRQEAGAHGRHGRMLALLLLLDRRLDEACEACNDALACEPLAFDLHFYQAYAHLKSGRVTAALEALRRTLFLEPGFVLARYQLAFALHTAAEFDAAAREYRRVEREVEQGRVTRLESAPEAGLVQSFWIADRDIAFLSQSNRRWAEQGMLPVA